MTETIQTQIDDKLELWYQLAEIALDNIVGEDYSFDRVGVIEDCVKKFNLEHKD